MDRADFFCPSPTRARQSSNRARPESDSHSNISSEPEPSPTESISQLFILMPHLGTFFMNSLALLNSGHQQINARSHKQALLNAQACTRRPISIFKLNDSHCKNVLSDGA